MAMTLAVGALACSSPEMAAVGGEEWRAVATTEDNITTVRTLSGSVWGGTARLVESLSIGVDQGDEPYMFGSIAGVAASADRIYVLDRSVPALRVYDHQGQHLLDIGQEGEGPGEFRRPDGLLVDPAGRIYVRDSNQGRITVFDAEGQMLDTYPLDQGFVISGSAMVRTDDGKIYSPGRVGDMPTDIGIVSIGQIPMGMIPRGPDGQDGEPIPRPSFDYEPPRLIQQMRSGGNVMVSMSSIPFTAEIAWALAPSGAMIAGVGDDYSFDITYPDGRVTRVMRDWEPVAVDAAEAAWNKEQIIAQMRQNEPDWVWNIDEIATRKPAYDQLIPDRADRVWVDRPGPGTRNPACEKDPETGVWEPDCWRDERRYEVFDLEGRFLGGVEVPEGVRITPASFIDAHQIITRVEDDLGVFTVKRFEIVVPGEISGL